MHAFSEPCFLPMLGLAVSKSTQSGAILLVFPACCKSVQLCFGVVNLYNCVWCLLLVVNLYNCVAVLTGPWVKRQIAGKGVPGVPNCAHR